MTFARREIVSQEEEGIYHCIGRCVRRAFLCGFDGLTGKDFDHRKTWIVERLRFLATVFTIEVLAYAIMSTHEHTLLRNRPDILGNLSDEEIARRWLLLYPKRKNPWGGSCEPNEFEIKALLRNKKYLKELRTRLGNISWFMKSLHEYIARLANAEDDCKGRFWEGRFKCQKLDSEAAVLVCATYIDLNPVRAKVAGTPEESLFTSVWERIQALEWEETPREDDGVSWKPAKFKEPNLWLTPICDTPERRGFLSIDLPTYLKIVDETGRELQAGKRGRISNNLAPILDRIGINSEEWLNTTQHYGKRFYRFVGSIDRMAEAAREAGKKWFKGLEASRRAFQPACQIT